MTTKSRKPLRSQRGYVGSPTLAAMRLKIGYVIQSICTMDAEDWLAYFVALLLAYLTISFIVVAW